MSRYLWALVSLIAIFIYAKVAYIWVPVIWQGNWADAMIVAVSLLMLSINAFVNMLEL